MCCQWRCPSQGTVCSVDLTQPSPTSTFKRLNNDRERDLPKHENQVLWFSSSVMRNQSDLNTCVVSVNICNLPIRRVLCHPNLGNSVPVIGYFQSDPECLSNSWRVSLERPYRGVWQMDNMVTGGKDTGSFLTNFRNLSAICCRSINCPSPMCN